MRRELHYGSWKQVLREFARMKAAILGSIRGAPACAPVASVAREMQVVAKEAPSPCADVGLGSGCGHGNRT